MKGRDTVSFSMDGIDRHLLHFCADRAARMDREANGLSESLKELRLHHRMNLVACHANGNPLDFDKLARADQFNFAHDVFGIDRKIDRGTGKLTKFFSPRCSLREPVA